MSTLDLVVILVALVIWILFHPLPVAVFIALVVAVLLILRVLPPTRSGPQ